MGLGKFIAGIGVAAVTGVVAGKKIVDKQIEKHKKKKEVENGMAVTNDTPKMIQSSETQNVKFCVHCGTKLDINAKFCSGCGIGLDTTNEKIETAVSIVEENKEQKCPRCGAPIDELQEKCVYCDYEFNLYDKSLKELYKQLDDIEKQRILTQEGFFKTVLGNEKQIDNRKAELIRNFSIPNSKEKLFEFLLLSSSNIQSANDEYTEEAWLAKFKQAYEKACRLYRDDEWFVDYQKRNKKTIKNWLE